MRKELLRKLREIEKDGWKKVLREREPWEIELLREVSKYSCICCYQSLILKRRYILKLRYHWQSVLWDLWWQKFLRKLIFERRKFQRIKQQIKKCLKK